MKLLQNKLGQSRRRKKKLLLQNKLGYSVLKEKMKQLQKRGLIKTKGRMPTSGKQLK